MPRSITTPVDRRGKMILLLIVAIALAVRVPLIGELPAWYTDEGFYLNAAWEFVHGRAVTSGIGEWTFFSPFSTTPPLYHALLGTLAAAFGKSLIVGRLLSAFLGMATVLSIFFIAKRIFASPLTGLIASAAYAVIPEIVVNNRWGLPQNLSGLLLLWSFYLFWSFQQTGGKRYHTLGVIVMSLALLTQFWNWWFLIAVPFFFRGVSFRVIVRTMMMILLPSVVVFALRFLTAPQAFMLDFQMALSGKLVAGLELSEISVFTFLTGPVLFLSRDFLFFLAAAGFIFIRPKPLRSLMLVALAVTAIPVLLLRSDFLNYFYSGLLFTPLLLLGVGGWGQLSESLKHRFRAARRAFVVGTGMYLLFLVITTTTALFRGDIGKLATSEPFIYRADVQEMKKVVNYLNEVVQFDDFVVAPSHLNWALHARSVDIVWVACYEHRPLLPNLWDSRFTAPMSLDAARYLVEDRYFPGDAHVCGEFRYPLIQRFRTEWSVVYKAERFIIYENPSWSSS